MEGCLWTWGSGNEVSQRLLQRLRADVPHPSTSHLLVPPLPPKQYTLILPATKNLPSQMTDFMKGTTIHRKSVGVRMPADDVCMVRGPPACCFPHPGCLRCQHPSLFEAAATPSAPPCLPPRPSPVYGSRAQCSAHH